jgi:spore maturation protein A
MNAIWFILLMGSILVGIVLGRGEAMTDALLASGGEAVAMCLSLAGAYALWCGVMNILEAAGAMDALARAMRPLLARLFPEAAGHTDVERAIATNLSANMLGLGNAATPAGIEAMRGMQALNKESERATDGMCMFLVVNASSLQLLPTTIISLRAAAGAAAPFDIVLPSLVATACSTVAAIAAMLLYRKGERVFGWRNAGGAARFAAHGDLGGRVARRRRL